MDEPVGLNLNKIRGPIPDITPIIDYANQMDTSGKQSSKRYIKTGVETAKGKVNFKNDW